jgi:hypothetical protein
LTARRAGIHEPSCGKRTDNARNAYFPCQRVNPDLNKLGPRCVHQLFALGASTKERRTGITRTRRGVGAASYRSRRQLAVAELDGHGGNRDAKILGSGLANHRVGAGPQIVCSDLHRSCGICHQADPRCSRAHVGGIYRAGATPTDQPVAVAHRAGLRAAVSPAEAFRGLIIAFHEGSGSTTICPWHRRKNR